MFRITQIARAFGLSRSTLLYYDRIGLLKASGRSSAGYRLYSPDDRERLATICSFRDAGLAITDISRILCSKDPLATALQRRLRQLGQHMSSLHMQQRLLVKMLRIESVAALPVTVDKECWVEMLRAAGMDDQGMESWHAEFERRAPEAHHEFLLSLGVSEEETAAIREWAKQPLGRS